MSLTGDTETSEAEAAVVHKAEMRLHHVRALYQPGKQFRVVKPNARLEAILLFGESSWAGWSRPLREGQILTCTGWKEGMGGNGFEEVNFTAPGVPENAQWCQVWPMSGLFRPFPMEGYLEPVANVEVVDHE